MRGTRGAGCSEHPDILGGICTLSRNPVKGNLTRSQHQKAAAMPGVGSRPVRQGLNFQLTWKKQGPVEAVVDLRHQELRSGVEEAVYSCIGLHFLQQYSWRELEQSAWKAGDWPKEISCWSDKQGWFIQENILENKTTSVYREKGRAEMKHSVNLTSCRPHSRFGTVSWHRCWVFSPGSNFNCIEDHHPRYVGSWRNPVCLAHVELGLMVALWAVAFVY